MNVIQGKFLNFMIPSAELLSISGKQAKRFIKAMVKAERNHKKQKLKVKFQNMFKVVADLFKVGK